MAEASSTSFRVTHYFCRPPVEDAWVEVPFLVRKSDSPSGPFYMGFNQHSVVSPEEVREREQSRTLRRLEFTYAINDQQSIWLSPRGEVWLAAVRAPLDDHERILIDAQELRTPPVIRGQNGHRIRTASEVVVSRPNHDMRWVNAHYIPDGRYSAFADAVKKRFADVIGARDLNPKGGEIRWDTLASQMCRNQYEFCADPIYCYGLREDLIDVVAFGMIKTFTFVVARSRVPDKEILRDAQTSLARKLEGLYLIVPGLRLGTLGETAAAHYVDLCVSTMNAIPVDNHDSALALACWCAADPDHRVIVCDIGIADQIASYPWAQIDEELSARRLADHAFQVRFRHEDLKCYFPKEILVGFMYPRGDLRWRRCLEEALRKTFWELWDQIDWLGVMEDLRAVDIEPLDFRTMCHHLGFDDEYDRRTSHRTTSTEGVRDTTRYRTDL